MDHLIGQQLDKYTILSELGRGGMAVVFLAHDTEMDREVAIKVLPREFTFERTFVERFQQEAKAIARLNHPHILPVFDYGQADGWTFIAMTYMPGGSLADRIRQMGSTYPFDQILDLVTQIAGALDYAHTRNIIHRDFKPANVLMGDHDHVALSDFGIAKMTEATAQLTGSGLIGTPAYMAPEMARRGGVTPMIDIYALGVTLYQMITGLLPYDADTPLGLLMAHANEPIPDPRAVRPDTPDDLYYVVQRALSKHPAQRYQTARALSDDLQAALGGVLVREAFTQQMDSEPVPLQTVQINADAAPTTQQVGQKEDAKRRGISPLAVGGIVAGLAALSLGVLFALGVLPPAVPAAPAPTQEVIDSVTQSVSASPTAISLMPTMRVLSGNVETLSTVAAAYEALVASKPLSVGDTIRTGADGAALLTFAPGVSAEVHPSSEVTVVRLEVVDGKLVVELRQLSGTTLHYLEPGSEWAGHDFTLLTPAGTITDIGTTFWASDTGVGWMFLPSEGSIQLDLGGSDEDATDNFLAHASNGDCLLAHEGVVGPCSDSRASLTALTDGSGGLIAGDATPTATRASGDGAVVTSTKDSPTATACAEQYYCSTDPSQKGTLIHVRADCSIELLPGNPQCAGDLGGGQPAPGCGACDVPTSMGKCCIYNINGTCALFGIILEDHCGYNCGDTCS